MITLIERFGSESLRFRVAEWIHKLRPSTCLGDLSLWALFPDQNQFYGAVALHTL